MSAPKCPKCGEIIGLPEVAGEEHSCPDRPTDPDDDPIGEVGWSWWGRGK